MVVGMKWPRTTTDSSTLPVFKNLQSLITDGPHLPVTKEFLPVLKKLDLPRNKSEKVMANMEDFGSLAPQIENLAFNNYTWNYTWVLLPEFYPLLTSLRILKLHHFFSEALEDLDQASKLEELEIDLRHEYPGNEGDPNSESEEMLEFFDNCEDEWIHRVSVTITRGSYKFNTDSLRATLDRRGVRYLIRDKP